MTPAKAGKRAAPKPPFAAMEARSVDTLPEGKEWQYEPKWDGFRGLAFRDGEAIELQSKAGTSLGRYFPEVIEALRSVRAKRFVLDGELVVPVGGALSFDDLLQRLHPAESRVRKLSLERPARYIVFDLLGDEKGTGLQDRPLAERRERLERFAGRFLDDPRFVLSPATLDPKRARRWLASRGGTLDGVIAKRRDVAYAAGERTAMEKVKDRRTADCVVGGFRYAQGKKELGSLLLGLYDDDGLLHHVGFTSSLARPARIALLPELEKLVKEPGFTGNAPGGPSRWSRGRSAEWKPLRTKLVAEVEYDHVTGGRFRHGTKFVRFRPDKAPRQCTFEQVEHRPASLERFLAAERRAAQGLAGTRPQGA